MRCSLWPIVACQREGEVEVLCGGELEEDICGGGKWKERKKIIWENMWLWRNEGNKENRKKKRNE